MPIRQLRIWVQWVWRCGCLRGTYPEPRTPSPTFAFFPSSSKVWRARPIRDGGGVHHWATSPEPRRSPYLPRHGASSSGGGSDSPRLGSGAGSIRPQLCPPPGRTRQKRLWASSALVAPARRAAPGGTAAGRKGGTAPPVRTPGGKRRQAGAVLRSEQAVLPGSLPARPESASGRQRRQIPEPRPRRLGSPPPPPPPLLPHPTQLPPLRPSNLGNVGEVGAALAARRASGWKRGRRGRS